jgi:hypothetical protein
MFAKVSTKDLNLAIPMNEINVVAEKVLEFETKIY